MKITKLDKRFNYFEYFDYMVSFSDRITISQGPLHFIKAQKWFTDTYGFTAEIRIWMEIKQHYNMRNQFNLGTGPGILTNSLPDSVNKHWSYSNYARELRIYVAGDKELGLYKLAVS